MITDQVMLYPVVEYLRRYSSGPFRLVASVSAFARLLSQSYATLPGSLLEGLAKLLLQDVKLYLYPVPLPVFLREQEQLPRKRVTASSQSGVVSVDDLRCEPPLDHLLRYLQGAEWIVPLQLPTSSPPSSPRAVGAPAAVPPGIRWLRSNASRLLSPLNHHDIRLLLYPLEDDRGTVWGDVEATDDDVATEIRQLAPLPRGEFHCPEILVLDVSAQNNQCPLSRKES